jgi:hypothetical protein
VPWRCEYSTMRTRQIVFDREYSGMCIRTSIRACVLEFMYSSVSPDAYIQTRVQPCNIEFSSYIAISNNEHHPGMVLLRTAVRKEQFCLPEFREGRSRAGLYLGA